MKPPLTTEFPVPTLRRGSCLCQEVVHDDACHEYIIRQPKPSWLVFAACMVVLNAIGYHVQVYAQDQRLLSVIVLILLVLLIININITVQQESLLVMSSIGVQYTIQFVSGRRKAEFMSHTRIRDIIINEAVSMHRVIYYLAILLMERDKVASIKPIFTESLPRLEGLVRIYRGIQSVMDQSKSEPVVT